jgi:hypothetical protein
LAGVSTTADIGTVVDIGGFVFSITGVSTDTTVDQLSTEALFALTGVSTSATLGNVLVQISQDLTGVTSTANISTTGLNTSTSSELSGVESSNLVDTIVTTGGQASATSLTGVYTAAALNIVFPEIAVGLTSVTSTGTITDTHVIGDFPEITGTTQNVMEYIPFTTSWAAPGPISSFIFSTPIPGVELYSLGNTLYAAGQTSDILERTIEYVDSNINLKTVSHFSDLPNKYHGVTKYSAPEVYEKLFYVTVNYYDETSLETKTIVNGLIVEYNYEVSKQALKDAARKVPA